MPAFLTSPAYKTAINKHLVQTTLYQLSFHTILATTNTLFKPHSINCHFIQDCNQQTPCSNHTLSIVISYNTGNNKHLVQTTLYQLSFHTRLAINKHLVQTTLYQLSFHTILATTNTLFKHSLSIVISYKTGNNKHLVRTTLYQLSCDTRLETINTLFKPHSINCHVIQDWKQ